MLELEYHKTGSAKAAWSTFFGPWSEGAAMFIQDARGKFNPKETLSFLAKYPITTFCAPPTVYRLLVLEDLKAYKDEDGYFWFVGGYTPSDQLAEELQKYVKKVTAPYKYPREIEFVKELPKTIRDKIRRVELRERERARKAGK